MTSSSSPTPAAAGVLFETMRTASGHVFGRATLDMPANLNALSLAMIDRLAPQLDAWAADAQVAGVVLDASGEKAFCAGGDVVALVKKIRALRQAATPSATAAPAEFPLPPEASDFFEREYRLDYRIHTYPKPLLCWGGGIVMGGGVGLLAGASHKVATPKTRLAMPEVAIGLYPDVGGSWFLRRMPGRAGAFLALTAAPFNSADALLSGLADAVLPHEGRPALFEAIAGERWSGRQAEDGERLTQLLTRLGAGVEQPASQLRAHEAQIESVIGDGRMEGIAQRLSSLAGSADPWLANAAAAFAHGSPTSAVLSLDLLQRAKGMSLADVFRLEYQASVGCCAGHDFPEGVRALLIDKDKTPRWQPATLAEVTPAHIDTILAPRFSGPHPLADLQ